VRRGGHVRVSRNACRRYVVRLRFVVTSMIDEQPL
jgi:hypothetical protein